LGVVDRLPCRRRRIVESIADGVPLVSTPSARRRMTARRPGRP
jgi:hypothetical protein